ncbi:hypothetical protein HDV04_003040 [Boothiomyces sp. JEL0838]|nr:hypothetical protein HDV04_003040 [Boothiomyces sp. JEL0838]
MNPNSAVNPNISFSNIASGRKPQSVLNKEDFPALGGQLSKLQNQTRQEILMSNLLGTNNVGSSIMTPGNMEFTSTNRQTTGTLFGNIPTNPVQKEEYNDQQPKNEKFGLLGLIDVIRMTNPDLTMLSLGCDLTTLGLDLNSSDNVHSSFINPFSDTPTAGADPSFKTPPAYLIKNIPPAISKMSLLPEQTLFYIFYSLPKDILQEAASQELYHRNWRFHKDFKLWVIKENLEAVFKDEVELERGTFLLFDPSTLQKIQKNMVIHADQIEERVPLKNFQKDINGLAAGVSSMGINSFASAING